MSLFDPSLLSLLAGESSGGLLGGSFKPNADEGILTKMFGTNDPRDPRGAMMSGLAQGLLRGSFADGMAGLNRAGADFEDRATRRQAQSLASARDMLSLNEILRKQKESERERAVYQEYWQKRNMGGGMQGDANQAPMGAPGVSAMSGTSGGSGMSGVPGGSMGAEGMPPTQSGFGVAPKANAYQEYRQLGDHFMKNGMGAKAQTYYEAAERHRPKVSQTPHLMQDPSTGKLVQVLIADDGSAQILPYGAKPDYTVEDLGGSKRVFDRNTWTGGEEYKKTLTPGETVNHQIAAGNLGVARGNLQLARDRFNLDANSPQYMQTEGGIVALPKRPQPGAQLIGQPVIGQDGQSLGPPLKAIPASANTAIMTNLQNLNRAKQALALAQGGQVGSATGDQNATGVKGYLPNAWLNRMDGAGVDTRAAIADLGSLVIHDRSGAAVTAAEFPRLAPFIPQATDDRATVEKKLRRFVDVYQQETDAYAQTYSKEQGYRDNPVLKRSAGQSNDVLPGSLPLPANPTASSLKKGQSYLLPNGKAGVWDGLQFKTGGQ
jgi:hypothetical protein